jgi:hypothetical protein
MKDPRLSMAYILLEPGQVVLWMSAQGLGQGYDDVQAYDLGGITKWD